MVLTALRSPRLHPVLIALLLLAVYVVTMPRSITLEDAGLFQMICHEGGIGHPPGYPLFVVGCQGFVNLPFFSEGVFAGNFLSSIYAALAGAALYFVSCELRFGRYYAGFIALAYGVSATFWSQAIIIEVYSLAVLLFLLCLWLCLLTSRLEEDWPLYGVAFVYGLSLANHWPLQLLATPILAVVLVGDWKALLQRLVRPLFLLKLIALLLLGLAPYLTLLQADPPMAVFGAIGTAEQFFNYVSRAPYSDQFAVATIADKWHYQRWVLLQTLREFSLLAPLVFIGLVLSFRHLPKLLAVGLVLLYLGGTSVLIMLLGFEYSELRVAIFRPYPIIAYIAPALWLGLGARWLVELASPHFKNANKILPVVMLFVVLAGNFTENYRAGDSLAVTYANQVFSRVPEGSVLFLTGDTGIGVLGYLHHVEGVRPDLDLRSWNSLVFGNRLTSAFAPQQLLDETRLKFVETTKKRVFSNVPPDFPSINRGIVFEYSEKAGFECDNSIHGYIDHLVSLDQTAREVFDGHQKELLSGLLTSFTRQYIGIVMFNSKDAGCNRDGAMQVLQNLQLTFPGKLATLETLLQYPQGREGKALLHDIATQAADTIPSGASSHVKGLLEEYRGRIAMLEPADPQKAVGHFRASVEDNPVAENASHCLLADMKKETGASIEDESTQCSRSR